MTKVAIHDETCSIFFDEKSHKKCDNKSAKTRGQKIGQKDETSNRAKNRARNRTKKIRQKIGHEQVGQKTRTKKSDKENRT